MRTDRASRKSTPFIRALLGASWVVVAVVVGAVVDVAITGVKPDNPTTSGRCGGSFYSTS
jgi:hypothetical protein